MPILQNILGTKAKSLKSCPENNLTGTFSPIPQGLELGSVIHMTCWGGLYAILD